MLYCFCVLSNKFDLIQSVSPRLNCIAAQPHKVRACKCSFVRTGIFPLIFSNEGYRLRGITGHGQTVNDFGVSKILMTSHSQKEATKNMQTTVSDGLPEHRRSPQMTGSGWD